MRGQGRCLSSRPDQLLSALPAAPAVPRQEASGGWGRPEGPLAAASDFRVSVTKADLLLLFSRKKCIDLGLLPVTQEESSGKDLCFQEDIPLLASPILHPLGKPRGWGQERIGLGEGQGWPGSWSQLCLSSLCAPGTRRDSNCRTLQLHSPSDLRTHPPTM